MFNPTPAVAFLVDFCRPPWTLAAWRRERWLETKLCQTSQDAFGFISKHRSNIVRFLLGYSRLPLTKEPALGDLLLATGVAIAVPTSKVKVIDELCPPSAWIEGRDHSILVWRYIIPANATVARQSITEFAARFSEAHGHCRVDVLPLMIPVPNIDYRFELVFHRRERTVDLLSFEPPRQKAAKAGPESDEKFVRGDQVRVERGLPVIKKGWVPGEAITLAIGPPKQGKSLFVAKLASYITSGGSYEPGGWRPGWWDGAPVLPEARGSAIICEDEDPELETLARLQAAGCDMSKVHVRMLVPEIGVASKLKQITKLAEDLGDCRMISFSPFASALRIRNYTEDAVRDKMRPLQAWYRGRGLAVVAIVHVTDEGRTSGSKVIPRVCRSAISFDSGIMKVAMSNAAPMGITMPFRVEGAAVTIDGIPLETSRILLR